jgi:hypothetical protein
VRCPKCAQPCDDLGYKIPVPPKAKVAVWKSLYAKYFEWRRARAANLRQTALQRFHELEREVQRIEGLPENEGRRSLLKRLSADLKRVGLERL